MSEIQDFNNALNFLEREYRNEVKATAENLKDEADQYDTWDDFADGVFEAVDGHEWVIYTRYAQVVAIVSENNTYGAENYGEDFIIQGGDINWSGIAAAAMEQDVWEALGRLDVDEDWFNEMKNEDGWED